MLDTDFISKNMPLTSRFQAAESWDETTISGQTIAVPSNQASPMGKIVAIRQDLADKYGISSLDNWDDYMNYAKTIAEKETPESGIYALAASGDNNELWDYSRRIHSLLLTVITLTLSITIKRAHCLKHLISSLYMRQIFSKAMPMT